MEEGEQRRGEEMRLTVKQRQAVMEELRKVTVPQGGIGELVRAGTGSTESGQGGCQRSECGR